MEVIVDEMGDTYLVGPDGTRTWMPFLDYTEEGRRERELDPEEQNEST